MSESYGRLRRRRRKLLCGGWLASMGAALAGAAVLWSGSPEGGVAGLLIVAGMAALWHPWMTREGGVPVLIYHSVTSDGSWLPWSASISVSPELFARNLESLRRMGCTVVRTGELVAARKAGRPLARRPVVIQLDDGYLDNWVAALPLLKRYQMPATVFVSTDFIEPGNELRPTLDDVEAGRVARAALTWDGYLNWAELRAMQDSGLVDVEAHGVDHGRVPAGPGIVDSLTPENWRWHAWLQWRHMDGNKSSWHRVAEPPFEPVGTAVPESVSALAGRAWDEDGGESPAAFEARIRATLAGAKQILEQGLGRAIRIFCWPFNEYDRRAHELALEVGYEATTGGDGENRGGEDPTLISRCHVGPGAFGWPQATLDNIAFRANVRLFQGNQYWGLFVLTLNVWRRLLRVTRLSSDPDGSPA